MAIALSRKHLAIVAAAILLIAAAAALLSLRGCDQSAVEDPAQKPLPPFSLGVLETLPHGATMLGDGIKPQHWTTADLEISANRADVRGDLAMRVAFDDPTLDEPSAPPQHPSTIVRPVVLPQGQARDVETTLFCSDGASPLSPLRAEMQLLESGHEAARAPLPLSIMPAWQYHLVVLAREPTGYGFLSILDSVRAPSGDPGTALRDAHYRVSLVSSGPLPLPTNLLRWTSIAYLLWDDRDPQDLTPEQQQALVDWLHWGGQLIVSGPDSLDTLRDSFLAPYLPATSGGSWSIDQTVLDGWDEPRWVQFQDKPRADPAWSGVHLEPRDAVSPRILAASGDQPLVLEGRVGRGRVVVTAFRLSQRSLRNWPGFDPFFNAVLLRRPGRQFAPAVDAVRVTFAENPSPEGDGYPYSNVRLLTRDEGRTAAFDDSPRHLQQPTSISRQPDTYWYLSFGGWNDHSPISELSRTALREAAGIVVPQRSFVAWLVVAYVIALVPVNGLFFRLLGRVEFAWIAAPLITLVFAGLVVRMAELDVGFVRSRTDVSVIEMYAGHRRAHLTRYAALYGSLGANYRLAFADASAVALPMVSTTPSPVTLRENRAAMDDDAAVEIDDFAVPSNSTALFHGEEMLDAGGPFVITPLADGRYRIENRSELALAGAVVVLRNRSAWLGSLAAGETREFVLADEAPQTAWLRELAAVENFTAAASIDLRPLVLTAAAEAGNELRLVGWSEDTPSGLQVTPTASQQRGATLVVVHLIPAALPEPQADVNSRAEVQRAIGPPVLTPDPTTPPAN